MARVSQRASHTPASRTVAAGGAGAGPGAAAGGDLGKLPLRSAGFATSHERLPGLQKVTTAEYRGRPISPLSPASPASPVESDFAPTPIDATFGERIESPADRTTGGSALQQQRHRSDTLRAEDKPGSRMDRYGRDHAYDSDADADDEFERSVIASPTLPTQFDDVESDHTSESEDERESVGGEDTPTTQGWLEREGRSPTGNIVQWTEEQVADYVAALSPALKHYSNTFAEEGVNGKALIALHHDELRELGVNSIGHRLTILKAVYEQKRRSGVKIEEDDYVPLCKYSGSNGRATFTTDHNHSCGRRQRRSFGYPGRYRKGHRVHPPP